LSSLFIGRCEQLILKTIAHFEADKDPRYMKFGLFGFLRKPVHRLSVRVEKLAVWLRRAVGTDADSPGDEAAAAFHAYQELVENAHDVIYTHDLEGHFTSLNRAGEQITGYTRAEAAQMSVLQIVSPAYQDQICGMIARQFADEAKTPCSLEILAKDGRKVMLEVSPRLVLKDGQAVGVQGIARDVTQRRHLEEQLAHAQRMEAIGHLAGGVAHDFNNLLTVVTGYSELVLRRLDAESPVRQEIEQIKKAGERATTLTRQLLAFSRKQMLQPRVLDLNAVLSDVEHLLRRLIGENIQLTMVLGPDLKRVKADPGQMEQIIMNLAVNARDAMPQGGMLTVGTANVVLDDDYANQHVDVKPGQYVMLAVSDTGIGMDDHTRSHIFEPFFTTKVKGKGTGMGLSTVYGIVKQSGGYVWVYSEPNQGSTFKIYLPRIDDPIETQDAANLAEELSAGVETVLLVEDEEAVRSLVCKVLRASGYTVLESLNPADALRIAREHPDPIHLLLTDVVMPQMSGREVANQVIVLRPSTKVLFISGYTDDAIVHHGVLDPKTAFLHKPFSPDALARKVREVLDNSSQ
jgi:two-component system, cell cycle sensor histidine kinase and response regulator CckA